ncbi:hypothetical protein Tco_1373677 [Tanacetum coccineum]
MSSDEASSGVTYTSISSDYEEPSDAGSPRVVVYGYNGLPMHLVDPPSPDYVPGLEEPEQALLSPDYIPGQEYPNYLASSDDEIPIEDQPYAVAASPIALSLGYIEDSDPKEDPEDESEDGPFETDKSVATPPPVYRTTARMYIRAHAPTPFPSEAEVDKLLALPTLPPSPLTPLSSPLPQIPSLPTHTSPSYAEAPLGFREATIRLRAASPLPSPTLPPTHHPLPLPTPSTNRRANILEADILPRKRLCLTAPTSRFEVGESSTATAARQPGLRTAHTTDYGFVDMVGDALRRHVRREEGAPTTLEGVNARVTKLAETHERDTQDLMLHLERAQVCSAAVHYELQAYRAHTQIHDLCISSQEALTATLVAQVSSLQSQLIAALGQIQALQARDPAHVDDLEDADSCA